MEKLFLLPDPLEEGAPVPGSRNVYDVSDRGADSTGRSPATTALQAAIDHATRQSAGGTVLLPHGLYRTGTLTLKSNVTLYLAPGAVLKGSRDVGDYPVDPGRHESAVDASLAPDVRYFGRTMTFSRLLLIDQAENVRIAGRGTIDGDGTFLRTRRGTAPNLLRVRESSGIAVDDVLFRNAAAWSLHVLASSDVALRNIKVINDRANLNTDGIDLDMSSDVTIDRSFIYAKDDAVCVKATRNSDLSGDPSPTGCCPGGSAGQPADVRRSTSLPPPRSSGDRPNRFLHRQWLRDVHRPGCPLMWFLIASISMIGVKRTRALECLRARPRPALAATSAAARPSRRRLRWRAPERSR